MNRPKTKHALMIGAAIAVCSTLAAALPRYEAKADLAEKGTIVGTVSLRGAVPAPRVLKVETRDTPCHKAPVPDESIVVSRDGKIRWAVVSIKKIASGKPFPDHDPAKPIVIDQVGCRFVPHVVVVPVKRELVVRNSDGILHNVNVAAKRNRAKNIAMAGSNKEMKLKFRRAERMKVKCDAHPWMSAWIVAASHPYYAVTGKNGKFRMDDVPVGTYRLEVWHETLGKLEQEVTVVAGKDARVDFVLSRS